MTKHEYDAYVRECCDARAQMPPWYALFVVVLCLVAALLIQCAGAR